MNWTDLSDSELRARLIQRRVNENLAIHLVNNRLDHAIQDDIDRLLGER